MSWEAVTLRQSWFLQFVAFIYLQITFNVRHVIMAPTSYTWKVKFRTIILNFLHKCRLRRQNIINIFIPFPQKMDWGAVSVIILLFWCISELLLLSLNLKQTSWITASVFCSIQIYILQSPEPRDARPPHVQYRVGQVVKHKRWDLSPLPSMLQIIESPFSYFQPPRQEVRQMLKQKSLYGWSSLKMCFFDLIFIRMAIHHLMVGGVTEGW